MKRFLLFFIIGVLGLGGVLLGLDLTGSGNEKSALQNDAALSAEKALIAGSVSGSDGVSQGGGVERLVFSNSRAFGAACPDCPLPDVAVVAKRIEHMDGIRSIEITPEGIVCVVDRGAVTMETIANAFSIQGVEVW